MAADVEMLPLPKPRMDASEGGLDWTDDEMTDYARANVAHATAAKDAEIEARRDRNETMLRAFTEREAALIRRAQQVEARAERLAEAVFRKALGWRERTRLDKSDAQWMREKTYEQCADELDELLASLHPTAAQEDDDE